MRLYKDRYLLAKYDMQDRLLAVGTTPEELGFKTYYEISHALKNFGTTEFEKKYNLYKIDCLEKHDDCFKEEDEIFLTMFEPKPKYTALKEYALAHHTSLTTLWRRMQRHKLIYNDENGEIYEKEC